MGAHSHNKTNNSDRARREQLKRDSKESHGVHGEGKVKPGSKSKPVNPGKR